MQAVPLIVIVVLTAAKDAVEDLRRAKSDHAMNISRVHRLCGLENHNVVPRGTGLLSRVSGWWSRRVWDLAGAVGVGKTTTTGKSSGKKSAKNTVKNNRTGENTLGSLASNVSDDNASGAASLSSLMTVATDVTGIGRLATRVGSLAPPVPRSTGKISPFVPGTVSNPNATPAPLRFHNSYWQDLNVGDIIRVRENEEIPCDVVALASSDEDGVCYLETKNLDGETSLKRKGCIKAGKGLKHAGDFYRASFEVETEAPNKDLYRFRGVVRYTSYASEEDTVGESRAEAVGADNVLLRGCVLRNVSWVLCCVVATGPETKIMLNSGETPAKRTKMAKALNGIVYLNFALLFVMCFVAGLINGLFYRRTGTSRQFFEYRPYAGWAPAANGAVDFFVNLILYQTLVPISLYITIEIIKAFQAFFIYADVMMYYQEKDMPCTPKTWTISDDLGQIEYVFSDKTGTLTQNVMVFRGESIDGVKGIFHQQKVEKEGDLKTEDESKPESKPEAPSKPVNESEATEKPSKSTQALLESPQAIEFWTALALCHTVVTKTTPAGIEYQAESPDEAALVSAARDSGVEFVGGKRDGSRYLRQSGTVKKYQLLQLLAFDSTRKRMSVVVRRPDNSIVVYSKGADNVIYSRLTGKADAHAKEVMAKTAIHLGEFAEQGLRTLCVAKRELSESGYDDWKVKYDKASQCVDSTREEKIESAASDLEREMTLMGGTAIEDKLQEGVGKSIEMIHRAGVKLWVLTGDKVETAISIGFSCNLLTSGMKLLVLKGKQGESVAEVDERICTMLRENFGMEGTDEEMEEAKRDHSMPREEIGVVVDGEILRAVGTSEKKAKGKSASEASVNGDSANVTEKAHSDSENGSDKTIDASKFTKLHLPLKSHAHHASQTEVEIARSHFLLLCKQCQSVLCCRVSPAQKADIVTMVKHGLGVMTLAIGDGANDVAMIQTANVGVGIAGQEGRQAAMASDYAIAQFRYLVRLLLVHGRWSYRRLAQMIPCFFYKNVVFVFPLFWYGIFCNFDGTYLYEFSYLMLFNLFFTSVPVITMGCLDQDVPAKVGLAVPELYRRGIVNADWSTWRFVWLYMADGIYESVICFFFTWLLHNHGIFANQHGLSVDHRFWLGVYSAHIAVLSCNTYVLFRQYRWDWLTLLFWFLSIAILFLWTGVWTSSEPGSTIFYKAAVECYGSVTFWALFAVGCLCALIPRVLYDTVRQVWYPNDVDVVREQVREGMFDSLPRDFDPTAAGQQLWTGKRVGDVEAGKKVDEAATTKRSKRISKKVMGKLGKKFGFLGRIKERMVREGESSARSSLEGIRTSEDIGITTPSNLLRSYTNERVGERS